MRKPPPFTLDVAAYLAATAALDPRERAALLLFYAHAWLRAGSVPADLLRQLTGSDLQATMKVAQWWDCKSLGGNIEVPYIQTRHAVTERARAKMGEGGAKNKGSKRLRRNDLSELSRGAIVPPSSRDDGPMKVASQPATPQRDRVGEWSALQEGISLSKGDAIPASLQPFDPAAVEQCAREWPALDLEPVARAVLARGRRGEPWRDLNAGLIAYARTAAEGGWYPKRERSNPDRVRALPTVRNAPVPETPRADPAIAQAELDRIFRTLNGREAPEPSTVPTAAFDRSKHQKDTHELKRRLDVYGSRRSHDYIEAVSVAQGHYRQTGDVEQAVTAAFTVVPPPVHR